ncbi:MAG: TrmH family RNA methyltransferase, partial [Actinomycetota bacterium]|nr:TrmH family RNA methyltransferase [Actinomycetota bacterium]
MTVDISSPSNRRIIDTARLKTRRRRTDAGRFLIEGTRETARAAEAGVSMHEVFLCPEVAPTGTFSLAESLAATGARLTTVSAIAFAKLTMRQNPDGIVAVAATWVTAIEGLDRDLVLVAEAIEKPGNLGAMLRTADATEAALLVAEATVDPFNPNVVRASQGSLFSVPLAVTDTARAVEWARDHGPIF